ncbi:type IVB secretion system protein IcmH/DotU, partial [Pseudomonas syringae]
MQSGLEDHFALERDNTGSGNGYFTDTHNSDLFEGLQEQLLYSTRRVSERQVGSHVNPLVSAAGELLAQVAKLGTAKDVGDIHLLNVQLSDQVKLFEARARRNAIANEHLLAARYVLCTVVDEAVLNTVWGSQSDWSKISLLCSGLM